MKLKIKDKVKEFEDSLEGPISLQNHYQRAREIKLQDHFCCCCEERTVGIPFYDKEANM